MVSVLSDFSNRISTRLDSISKTCIDLKSSSKVITNSVNSSSLNLRVCAVDGGILYERLCGFDLFLLRSSSVFFAYENSNLVSFDYFPSKSPSSTPYLFDSLDESEALKLKSLLRIKDEISCALSFAKTKSPNVILLDGSIVPLASDRPDKNSSLVPIFDEILKLYLELFLFCKNNSILLCAVIKDSRSRSVSSRFDLDFNDIVLFDNVLDAQTSSEEFELTEKFGFSDFVFKFFYLKSTSESLPLRIEYLSLSFNFDVKNTIFSLCKLGLDYPPPLVEADLCATMEASDLELIKRVLPRSIKPLRRNSRLFR